MANWLKAELIQVDLPEKERAGRVAAVQQKARARLHPHGEEELEPAEDKQVQWLIDRTRPHESKQQITQRVWLAIVLYNLGCRGIRFDAEGQIHWDGGQVGRIGLSPDAVLDLAWEQAERRIYTASFRQPDGTILRGKGRQRWYVYRLTVDAAAAPLFKRYARQVREKVALIVASEIHATQPQLPRDYYGGDAFQQACIDAQDQQFNHILVLSPEHGVISLDEVVPSEKPWDEVLDRFIWSWQLRSVQRLGMYLFGEPRPVIPSSPYVNWWSWLNPESVYEITIFGGGFAVRIMLDYMARLRMQNPTQWPQIALVEQRPGYDVGDVDDEIGIHFGMDDEMDDGPDFEAMLQDIDQLLAWATEFVGLVNIFVLPTGETWQLAPDEALIPIRLLADTSIGIGELLDLLTDITLLLEQPLSMSMLISAGMVVSILLQITHNLVHGERERITELLKDFPEGALRQYIENILQETALEDQLCACLTLAEQMQLLHIAVSPITSDQLLIWLQTYISSRMRHRLMDSQDGDAPAAPAR